MRSLAKYQNQQPAAVAELVCARVVAERDKAFEIDHGGERLIARRAAGCLLAPAPGDEVLVALVSDNRVLITTVLERSGDNDEPGRLELEGDLRLRAPTGRVVIEARDGVALRTPGAVGLTGAELNITAAMGRVAIQRLSLVGELASATWGQVKLAARSSDTVVGRCLQRFKLRSCRVETVDQQQSKMLNQTVDELHTVQSGHTVMRAREHIRMDGKQIIMG